MFSECVAHYEGHTTVSVVVIVVVVVVVVVILSLTVQVSPVCFQVFPPQSHYFALISLLTLHNFFTLLLGLDPLHTYHSVLECYLSSALFSGVFYTPVVLRNSEAVR